MITLTTLTAFLKAGPTILATALGTALAWAFTRLAHGREEARMKRDIAEAITKNHAVEQKEAAATTDEDADAALDAASDAADHS